jgi:hypothetical protein
MQQLLCLFEFRTCEALSEVPCLALTQLQIVGLLHCFLTLYCLVLPFFLLLLCLLGLISYRSVRIVFRRWLLLFLGLHNRLVRLIGVSFLCLCFFLFHFFFLFLLRFLTLSNLLNIADLLIPSNRKLGFIDVNDG